MNKIKKILFVVVLVATFQSTSSYGLAKGITLFYDGEEHTYTGAICKLKVGGELVSSDVPPVIINDRSLVPVRAVFEKMGASVAWDDSEKKVIISSGDTKIELTVDKDLAVVNDKEERMDVAAKIINNRLMVPVRFVGEKLDMAVGWDSNESLVSLDQKEQTVNKAVFRGIGYTETDDYYEVAIDATYYSDYKTTDSMEGKIIVDFPNTIMDLGTIKKEINKDGVAAIRCGQYKDDVARVVVDTTQKLNYFFANKDGKLLLNVSKAPKTTDRGGVERGENNGTQNTSTGSDISGNASSSSDQSDTKSDVDKATENASSTTPVKGKTTTINKVFVYNSNQDRVHFLLKNIKLTYGGRELTKFYEENWENDGKRYIITFSSDLGVMDSSITNIDDSLFNSVEIKNDKETKKTSIIFNAKESLIYYIEYRDMTNDTAIDIIKPWQDKDKLVVIDPGHGGGESGAVYEGINEKEFNIDICIRLNNVLKSKGVNTYMMRYDDTYVSLFERAHIANSLNATLFLSVHNNAYMSAENGTETLYYPNSYSNPKLSGEAYAQIIQDKLVSALGTNDRKIVPRPNLVVLRDTEMPAILAEVAFMTNAKDLENLKDENFRQKAAQAIAEGVVESLNKIN